MRCSMRNDERGVALTLIGLIVAALIVAILFAQALKSYFGAPAKTVEDAFNQVGMQAPEEVVASGGSPAQAQGVVAWSRQQVQAAGQIGLDREKEFAETQGQ